MTTTDLPPVPLEPLEDPVPESRIDDDTPIWNSMAARWAKITGTDAPPPARPRRATVRKPRKPPTRTKENAT
jgi:hypothetical protein